jgi:hypothetical protein
MSLWIVTNAEISSWAVRTSMVLCHPALNVGLGGSDILNMVT